MAMVFRPRCFATTPQIKTGRFAAAELRSLRYGDCKMVTSHFRGIEALNNYRKILLDENKRRWPLSTLLRLGHWTDLVAIQPETAESCYGHKTACKQ